MTDTDLRAAIEKLADEARARRDSFPSHPHWEAWNAHESDLRALLADHPAPDEATIPWDRADEIREGAIREIVEAMSTDATPAPSPSDRALTEAATEHDCDTCADCIHDGHRCCGCYDGVCCRDSAPAVPADDEDVLGDFGRRSPLLNAPADGARDAGRLSERGAGNVSLSVWSNTCNAYCSEEDRVHAPECVLAASPYHDLSARLAAATEYATAAPRFWSKVNLGQACWLWGGSTNGDGYGRFSFRGRLVPAHWWSYQALVGPIPEGLEIDHLCRTRNCVKPDHLEPVTSTVNNIRRVAAQPTPTHCVHGHELTPDNSYTPPGKTHRVCRTCKRNADLRRRVRKAEERKSDVV